MEKSAGKRLLRLARVSAGCLLVLIFLLTAVTMAGVIFKNERELSPWGMGFFVVTTGSMEPALPVGSLVFVTVTPEDKIKTGDIVTFFASNMRDIVTHRVREISFGGDGRVFTTRGDANNTDDPPADYDRIIGRVLFSVPEMSLLAGSFKDIRYVGLAVIGIGVLICVIGVVSDLKKKR